jgi:hypothetical protein
MELQTTLVDSDLGLSNTNKELRKEKEEFQQNE